MESELFSWQFEVFIHKILLHRTGWIKSSAANHSKNAARTRKFPLLSMPAGIYLPTQPSRLLWEFSRQCWLNVRSEKPRDTGSGRSQYAKGIRELIVDGAVLGPVTENFRDSGGCVLVLAVCLFKFIFQCYSPFSWSKMACLVVKFPFQDIIEDICCL